MWCLPPRPGLRQALVPHPCLTPPTPARTSPIPRSAPDVDDGGVHLAMLEGLWELTTTTTCFNYCFRVSCACFQTKTCSAVVVVLCWLLFVVVCHADLCARRFRLSFVDRFRLSWRPLCCAPQQHRVNLPAVWPTRCPSPGQCLCRGASSLGNTWQRAGL